MTIKSVNPANGETLRTFEPLAAEEIESRLATAARVFRDYRKIPLPERERWMTRAAEILETERGSFGRLMTAEMGKTLKSAVDEAAKCATACRYYAENAHRIIADQEIWTGVRRSFVRFQPIGPILAVMPWNFPFWQVFRFAAPETPPGERSPR